MIDPSIHLKLDQMLAAQSAQAQATAQIEHAITALTRGLSALSDDLATQREVLAKLAEAMSAEQDGGEMRDLIRRIEASLTQIAGDGRRTLAALTGLPQAVADAVADGVRLSKSGE